MSDLTERLKEVAYRDCATTVSVRADDLRALLGRVDELEKALGDLVNAKALSKVRELVAGWNGEDRPEPYKERHPNKLGATLPKTNCGAVYELDEAMQAARTTLRSGDTNV